MCSGIHPKQEMESYFKGEGDQESLHRGTGLEKLETELKKQTGVLQVVGIKHPEIELWLGGWCKFGKIEKKQKPSCGRLDLNKFGF